jgi:hypothetical protein
MRRLRRDDRPNVKKRLPCIADRWYLSANATPP